MSKKPTNQTSSAARGAAAAKPPAKTVKATGGKAWPAAQQEPEEQGPQVVALKHETHKRSAGMSFADMLKKPAPPKPETPPPAPEEPVPVNTGKGPRTESPAPAPAPAPKPVVKKEKPKVDDFMALPGMETTTTTAPTPSVWGPKPKKATTAEVKDETQEAEPEKVEEDVNYQVTVVKDKRAGKKGKKGSNKTEEPTTEPTAEVEATPAIEEAPMEQAPEEPNEVNETDAAALEEAVSSNVVSPLGVDAQIDEPVGSVETTAQSVPQETSPTRDQENSQREVASLHSPGVGEPMQQPPAVSQWSSEVAEIDLIMANPLGGGLGFGQPTPQSNVSTAFGAVGQQPSPVAQRREPSVRVILPQSAREVNRALMRFRAPPGQNVRTISQLEEDIASKAQHIGRLEMDLKNARSEVDRLHRELADQNRRNMEAESAQREQISRDRKQLDADRKRFEQEKLSHQEAVNAMRSEPRESESNSFGNGGSSLANAMGHHGGNNHANQQQNNTWGNDNGNYDSRHPNNNMGGNFGRQQQNYNNNNNRQQQQRWDQDHYNNQQQGGQGFGGPRGDYDQSHNNGNYNNNLSATSNGYGGPQNRGGNNNRPFGGNQQGAGFGGPNPGFGAPNNNNGQNFNNFGGPMSNNSGFNNNNRAMHMNRGPNNFGPMGNNNGPMGGNPGYNPNNNNRFGGPGPQMGGNDQRRFNDFGNNQQQQRGGYSGGPMPNSTWN